MMKFITSLVIAAGVAVAVPAGLTTRQFGGITRNDLEDGSSSDCPQAILIFARATGEGGNIVGQSCHIWKGVYLPKKQRLDY